MTRSTSPVSDAREVIRLPLWFRVYVGTFAAVWCGFLGVVAVIGTIQGQLIGAAVGCAMLAFGLWLCGAYYRTSVEMRINELLVRNGWQTLRIRREDIEEFRPGTGREIYVLSQGDKLEALGVSSIGTAARRDRNLAALRAWAESQ